jgi:hypothetical protein
MAACRRAMEVFFADGDRAVRAYGPDIGVFQKRLVGYVLEARRLIAREFVQAQEQKALRMAPKKAMRVLLCWILFLDSTRTRPWVCVTLPRFIRARSSARTSVTTC